MKLFFDARYIRTDAHDGISRYSTELGNALATVTPVTFIICDPEQRNFLPKDAQCVQIHKPTSLKEPFTSLVLNKFKPDVVFTPMQTMGTFGRKFKLILTLHDLIYYKFRLPPPQCPPYLRLFWRLYHATYIPQRMVLNRADIVAAVSETTKQEMQAARLTKRPIIVVSNAARDLSQFLEKPVVQHDTPPKNLVFAGTLIPYKNAETLIKAMAYLPSKTLHLLGNASPKRRKELQTLIPAGADVRLHGAQTDVPYTAFLANDAIMLSASKAEGFGLPLIEALGIGVPAVVTDMPIFHEVAGDGALYADPNNPKDFAEKIVQLDDKKKREQLVLAAQKHIAKFSWQASAKVLLDACKALD